VKYTLVHAGKYRTEDKLEIQTLHKLNTTQKKQKNTKHSRTKLTWFSRLLWHSARKCSGLILQHSRVYTQQVCDWQVTQAPPHYVQLCMFQTLRPFPWTMVWNSLFIHRLYIPIYTRLQIFIQLSPTLTKLCHTKRDHLSNFLHLTRT